MDKYAVGGCGGLIRRKKGAVGIRINFKGIRMEFISCHLSGNFEETFPKYFFGNTAVWIEFILGVIRNSRHIEVNRDRTPVFPNKFRWTIMVPLTVSKI